MDAVGADGRVGLTEEEFINLMKPRMSAPPTQKNQRAELEEVFKV